MLSIAAKTNFSESQARIGTVVSSNSFPAPKELFDKIKDKNPDSIDMETSAFYQVAWLLKIPSLAVRGISNVLNQNGIDDKIHQSDVPGSTRAAAIVLLAIIDTLILELVASETKELKSDVDIEVKKIITSLNLQPHPEGGSYACTYQSTAEVKQINQEQCEIRSAGTSIYYLLNGNDFSAWHILKSDELWHYYKGSLVKIYMIDINNELHIHLLGDPTIIDGARFQVTITANNWFAAEIVNKNSYSLVGCTVNPGFDFKDFKLGDREELSALFPQHASVIRQFTRV